MNCSEVSDGTCGNNCITINQSTSKKSSITNTKKESSRGASARQVPTESGMRRSKRHATIASSKSSRPLPRPAPHSTAGGNHPQPDTGKRISHSEDCKLDAAASSGTTAPTESSGSTDEAESENGAIKFNITKALPSSERQISLKKVKDNPSQTCKKKISNKNVPLKELNDSVNIPSRKVTKNTRNKTAVKKINRMVCSRTRRSRIRCNSSCSSSSSRCNSSSNLSSSSCSSSCSSRCGSRLSSWNSSSECLHSLQPRASRPRRSVRCSRPSVVTSEGNSGEELVPSRVKQISQRSLKQPTATIQSGNVAGQDSKPLLGCHNKVTLANICRNPRRPNSNTFTTSAPSSKTRTGPDSAGVSTTVLQTVTSANNTQSSSKSGVMSSMEKFGSEHSIEKSTTVRSMVPKKRRNIKRCLPYATVPIPVTTENQLTKKKFIKNEIAPLETLSISQTQTSACIKKESEESSCVATHEAEVKAEPLDLGSQSLSSITITTQQVLVRPAIASIRSGAITSTHSLTTTKSLGITRPIHVSSLERPYRSTDSTPNILFGSNCAAVTTPASVTTTYSAAHTTNDATTVMSNLHTVSTTASSASRIMTNTSHTATNVAVVAVDAMTTSVCGVTDSYPVITMCSVYLDNNVVSFSSPSTTTTLTSVSHACDAGTIAVSSLAPSSGSLGTSGAEGSSVTTSISSNTMLCSKVLVAAASLPVCHQVYSTPSSNTTSQMTVNTCSSSNCPQTNSCSSIAAITSEAMIPDLLSFCDIGVGRDQLSTIHNSLFRSTSNSSDLTMSSALPTQTTFHSQEQVTGRHPLGFYTSGNNVVKSSDNFNVLATSSNFVATSDDKLPALSDAIDAHHTVLASDKLKRKEATSISSVIFSTTSNCRVSNSCSCLDPVCSGVESHKPCEECNKHTSNSITNDFMQQSRNEPLHSDNLRIQTSNTDDLTPNLEPGTGCAQQVNAISSCTVTAALTNATTTITVSHHHTQPNTVQPLVTECVDSSSLVSNFMSDCQYGACPQTSAYPMLPAGPLNQSSLNLEFVIPSSICETALEPPRIANSATDSSRDTASCLFLPSASHPLIHGSDFAVSSAKHPLIQDSVSAVSASAGGLATSLPVSVLNSHMVCQLCSGYFVDATTIIVCLHTCKLYLVRDIITRSKNIIIMFDF